MHLPRQTTIRALEPLKVTTDPRLSRFLGLPKIPLHLEQSQPLKIGEELVEQTRALSSEEKPPHHRRGGEQDHNHQRPNGVQLPQLWQHEQHAGKGDEDRGKTDQHESSRPHGRITTLRPHRKNRDNHDRDQNSRTHHHGGCVIAEPCPGGLALQYPHGDDHRPEQDTDGGGEPFRFSTSTRGPCVS
ncbi:hypothetical protein [Nocardia sp. NPDC050710]|uniref:hypothetical protein n=1 Tax=Nocardia sp. NPDC050710 TaxID=3157220 RepID=UPI0033DA137D